MTHGGYRFARRDAFTRHGDDAYRHHATENAVLFPMLLRRQGADGTLGVVVDRLRAEHHALTGLLDTVEQALGALPGDADAKAAATGAMARLSDQLEAHLRFEEEQLAPALNALSR